MKKTLFIALLFLIPFLGFSQTTKPIDGFMGIKFGSSKAQVISALTARGAKQVETNKPDFLFFTNVTLGHRTTDVLAVWFINDKFFASSFEFKAEVDDKTIEYYDSLVNDINDVYGAGKATKSFKDPYKDGDGYEITAIQAGDANYYTNWVDNGNIIQATITLKLAIRLLYKDTELAKEADALQKAKEKADF